MTAFDFSFIPGMMLGIELPNEPEGALLVIDLLILRLVVWRFTEEELIEATKKDKAP